LVLLFFILKFVFSLNRESAPIKQGPIPRVVSIAMVWTGNRESEPPDETFAAWIDKRRDQDQLRNDDVTLLAIGPIPEAANPPEDESP
jgi:hypothetical protein